MAAHLSYKELMQQPIERIYSYLDDLKVQDRLKEL